MSGCESFAENPKGDSTVPARLLTGVLLMQRPAPVAVDEWELRFWAAPVCYCVPNDGDSKSSWPLSDVKGGDSRIVA